MLDPDTSDPRPMISDAVRPLVRHTRREGWGRALMLWERDHKRGYQFEDGEVRVFAEPYYQLLQPAMRPDPVLRHQLRAKAVASGDLELADDPRTGKRQKEPVPTLDDQCAVFEALFPKGFHGDAWTSTHRSRPGGRRLKRHRDPAIEEAALRLDRSALRARIDEGRPGEVRDRIVEVVGNTDLATRAQLDAFRGLPVDVELAEAMLGYLHDIRRGDLATMARLRRALARQGLRKLPWTVITAPRALLYPQDHMWVSPSVVRAQAKLVDPRYKVPQVPTAADYSRCLELAMTVHGHLTKAGFAPRDLLDVTGFMRVTLAGPVKGQLVAAMVQRRARQAEDRGATVETSAGADVVGPGQGTCTRSST